jgi:hypothetical protein
MSKKRKRFNPLEEEGLSLDEGASLSALSEMGGEIREDAVPSPVERIERLRPSQMMPDRFQPRRLLPGRIRSRFFEGEIDCYQAAREWIEMAKEDEGWKARIDELLDMGGSFQAEGQIKPITGVWLPSEEGGFVFQIETGERRFWAACLSAVDDGFKGEPELRVEVIQQPTRKRQVLENRHAQNPSAVGQACEIAALMLEEMGIDPEPDIEDEFDYFRRVLDKRAPRGMWPKLEPIMQHSTRRMQQLLAVLRLPTPLLELADRHRLPERVLREVLNLPMSQWESAILSAVQEGLTAEEVVRLKKGRPRRSQAATARRSPETIALAGLRNFVRAVMNVDPEDQVWLLDSLADEVMVQGFGEAMLPLLEGLHERIETRVRSR